MWLELVPITHTHRCHALSCRSSPIFLLWKARCCLATALVYVLVWNLGAAPFFWTWCHGWVGGVPKFFPRPAKDDAFCNRRRSRPTLKPHSVVPHVRTGYWRLVLYCLRPCVDSPSLQWGQHSGAGWGLGFSCSTPPLLRALSP